MDKPIDNFWDLNLRELKQQLTKNGFDVYMAENEEAAKTVVLEDILPELQPSSLSWGGSLTLAATGLYEHLKDCGD